MASRSTSAARLAHSSRSHVAGPAKPVGSTPARRADQNPGSPPTITVKFLEGVAQPEALAELRRACDEFVHGRASIEAVFPASEDAELSSLFTIELQTAVDASIVDRIAAMDDVEYASVAPVRRSMQR